MIDWGKLYELALQVLAAGIGSFGFSVLFNIRGKKLFADALGGAFAWACYLIFSALGLGEAMSYFLVALFVSLYAEVMARHLKAPVTIFVAPSLIPLVPGSALYYTMAYALGGNTMQFLEKAGSALSIASALAGGIIVSAVFVRLLFKLRNIKFEGKMQ